MAWSFLRSMGFSGLEEVITHSKARTNRPIMWLTQRCAENRKANLLEKHAEYWEGQGCPVDGLLAPFPAGIVISSC